MKWFCSTMTRTANAILFPIAVCSSANVSAEGVTPLPPSLMDVVLGDDGQPVPRDSEGLPTRPLSDGEVHRILLHLSRSMDAASLRLARCHAAGTPFGSTGWRSCIERP